MRHRQTRQHRRQSGEQQLVSLVLRSDNMDKFPNDWLEATIVTVCIVAIAGGALALFSMMQAS